MSNTGRLKDGHLKVHKEVEGMLECVIDHEIKETKSFLDWKGGVITRQVWNDILSFFRWTYDTTKSESQVRLFYNTNTKEWKAWAFPQEARTGMAAHELPNEDTEKQQAEQFGGGGWLLFSTVHHHCSSSAFQSSTDMANEVIQDGIHITVGKIGSKLYDIHYRVYIGGVKISNVKLSQFWDVSELPDCPAEYAQFIPEGALEKICMYQMGVPPAPDWPFPEQWKDNMIERKAVAVTNTSFGPPSNGHFRGYGGGRQPMENRYRNSDWDKKNAFREIASWIHDTQNEVDAMTLEAIVQILEELDNLLSGDHFRMMDILAHNDLYPEEILQYILEFEKLVEEREQKKEQKKLEQEASKMEDEGGSSDNGNAPFFNNYGMY